MISRSAQDLNATELLCSFILNASVATLVAIRRRAGHNGVEEPVPPGSLPPD